MLAGYSRFLAQIDLASRHLTLGEVVESQAVLLERVAAERGRPLPDAAERRRLAYRSAIIELYAALEDYVMESAAAYAGALRHVVPKFADLPDRVRENNLTLTLRVLSQRNRKVWHGRIDVSEMLERLLACATQSEAYQLNDVVFREHTANFRAGVVHQFFARLDVDLDRFLGLAAADRFVNSDSPLSGIVVGARGAIDLLADRRNEVAHGCTDTDTLSLTLLAALLQAVRLYGVALQDALLDSLATRARNDLQVFGRVVRVFRAPTAGDGEIAGVRASSVGHRLRANDWAVFRKGDGDVLLAQTRSIHIDRRPTAEWVSGDGVDSEGGVWVTRPSTQGWDVCAPPDSLRRALGL